MSRTLFPWLTALVVIAGDRFTKLVIVDRLDVGAYVPVFQGFAITHVHNRGIAFSLFADGGWASRLLIHAVIFAAVVIIAWMLVHNAQRGWLPGLSFGLILGGAVGNLIDRILYGYVVDFLHLWIELGGKHWSWPDFNVADSAITVGACLLILLELAGGAKKPEQDHASDSD